MKKRTGIMGILIAILILGIGYAVITDVTVKVSGAGTISANQNNFRVKFTGTPTTTGIGTINATIEDDLQAKLTVTGLTKMGDTATAIYEIANESPELGADLVAELKENTNSEYFKITYSLQSNTIASGETTKLTVYVEALKTPESEDQSTSFEVDVVASPQE